MAITAASIEANGWVLAITHNRGLGSFASYALTPDAGPALTVNGVHPGYDLTVVTGGGVVSRPRSFIGTKPLRQAAVVSNAGVLSAKLIDETDNGNGTITVRIALSNWVYATDTGLTLTAAAGWRIGEAAATISVTNNSTVTCPAPIHRWADVPYRLQRGSFDVEMLVFGFFPQGTQPVAAVKFTVTDGTTVKTYWSSALSSSTQFGDNLRCYRVTVDPSTATALTAGLLRIDAEIYPWIGAMRPTDVAGTKAMANLATTSGSYAAGDAMLGKAQSPFAVAWDPIGARYPFKCVYVDFINGTATASTAMIGSGSSDATALSAAKAVAPAARAKDTTTALEALRLASFSYPAANGQAASSVPVVDGCRIVLAPQTHTNGLGATSVGYSPQAVETWLRVEGDPADSNPRQDVIVRTNAGVSPGFQAFVQRAAFANMSIELGYDFLLYTRYQWFDNVELRGQTGQTLSSRPPVGGAVAPAGYLGVFFTRSRIWKTGCSFNVNFGARAKLVRGCEHRRQAEAPVCVKNRVISETEDSSFAGVLGVSMSGALSSFTDDLSIYDSIFAYCDSRANKEAMWNSGFLAASYTANPIYAASQNRRQVCFGNIGERIGASVDKMFNSGEQSQADMAESIVEANTVAGERVNWGYNDAKPVGANTAAGVAATDVQAQNTYVNVRVAGNVFGAHFTKHDRFDDPAVKAQRVAAGDPRNHGVRPYNTGCYAALYGVGQRDNVNLAQTNIGVQPESFNHEYEGLNCRFDLAPIDPKFTNDQSRWRLGTDCSATATGVGDYTPLAGSPALARVASGNSDRDALNAPRSAVFAAGAIEGIVAVALIPASARNGSLVSSPAVGWTSLLRGAPSLLASRARSASSSWTGVVAGVRNAVATRSIGSGLTWTALLNPNRSTLTTRASPASASWAGMLTGTHSVLAMRAGAAALGTSGSVTPTSLSPDSIMHVLLDAFSLNLQPGGNDGGSIRTILVPSDFRVHSIALS